MVPQKDTEMHKTTELRAKKEELSYHINLVHTIIIREQIFNQNVTLVKEVNVLPRVKAL